MLLSVVRTLGWVFKVCWVYFKSFRHFYFSLLANGREQMYEKRVLERLQLYHHQHVKIREIIAQCLNHLDKYHMKGYYKILNHKTMNHYM
jgi:hypothetical protein